MQHDTTLRSYQQHTQSTNILHNTRTRIFHIKNMRTTHDIDTQNTRHIRYNTHNTQRSKHTIHTEPTQPTEHKKYITCSHTLTHNTHNTHNTQHTQITRNLTPSSGRICQIRTSQRNPTHIRRRFRHRYLRKTHRNKRRKRISRAR